jgi:hypothetical protein
VTCLPIEQDFDQAAQQIKPVNDVEDPPEEGIGLVAYFERIVGRHLRVQMCRLLPMAQLEFSGAVSEWVQSGGRGLSVLSSRSVAENLEVISSFSSTLARWNRG